MKPHQPVFVVGGAHTNFIGKHHPDFIWKGHPEFGKRQNPTLQEYIDRAVLEALEVTGIEAAAIEKGYIGNFAGELFAQQGHLGSVLAGVHPDLEGKPFARTEAACASGGIAVLSCIEAMQAGYDVTLAVGAEVQTSVSAKVGADYLARGAHYATQRSIDEFTFPCLLARRAKAYKQTYGISDEDIGRVVVKAYSNANCNPRAHMHSVRMTLDQAAQPSESNPYFLSNTEYTDHMKVADCSQVSDGASALILATGDGLARLGIDRSRCTKILAYAHTTSALQAETDPIRLSNTKAAATEVYRDSGFGPHEMQVAEVHDCFAVVEILMLEALGFADAGHAAAFVRAGHTDRDGHIPVNSGGGLLAFGHPVGATGVKQVLEIHRQMKALCGEYQIATPPQLGISANMGGDDKTSVVMLQRNVL